ncbi:MAG: NADPH-dependent FMN reductase [Thermoanaerobaculia bacterium]
MTSDPSQPKLQIFITSTRERRLGPAVATWFTDRAREHAGFQIELVDLQAVALPILDEPNHPMKRDYQHDHTKAWSASVASADAFAFVVPEYNHGMPPALLNALDYLYVEWNYKPVAFVSYGGVSGGSRSVQMANPLLTALKMMPIPESVTIPFFTKLINAEGIFDPGETPHRALTGMLDELLRWTQALKTMRAQSGTITG